MPDQSPTLPVVYANGFGFALGDNDFRLTFGVSDAGNPAHIVENVAVFMTHKSLKLLAHSLTAMITNYEQSTGTSMPIDSDKIRSLEQSLSAASNSTSSEQLS